VHQKKRLAALKKSKRRRDYGYLFRRKKMCYFTANKLKEVDYKDVNLLRKFIMENGKIVPSRIYRYKSLLAA